MIKYIKHMIMLIPKKVSMCAILSPKNNTYIIVQNFRTCVYSLIFLKSTIAECVYATKVLKKI